MSENDYLDFSALYLISLHGAFEVNALFELGGCFWTEMFLMRLHERKVNTALHGLNAFMTHRAVRLVQN